MVSIVNILTKEFVTTAVVSGKRSRDIAKETGINDRTIRWYFKKYQLVVPKHKPHEVWNKGLNKNVDKRIEKLGKAVSKANTGKEPWNKGKELPPLSEETKKKQSIALKGVYVGEKNAGWKGGKSPENKRIRRSSAFFKWRKSVFERDNYTCQECKVRGGTLHPHHIKQFAYFPELRFDVNNGLTLCKECHKKTDTWGYKTTKNNAA